MPLTASTQARGAVSNVDQRLQRSVPWLLLVSSPAQSA
jgi:hypothetical protein